MASATKVVRGFNDMSHLSIKRFADGDPVLRPGAVRARAKLPWDAMAELDPSGRSTCKHCGSVIPKGDTRLVLLMQCNKGYKVREKSQLPQHAQLHYIAEVTAVIGDWLGT